jgi:polyisoprenoid-binding protein YceI
MTRTGTTGVARSVGGWTLDRAHSSIWFSGRQLGISTIRGWFREFEVTLDVEDERPETATVEARIAAASLETGDPQRDGHLRSPDFLDAEHHPWITFRSTRVEPLNGEELRMDGALTIRDVTRPIALDVTFHGFGIGMAGERRAGFTGRVTLDRTEWGLTWNVPIGEALLVSREIELVIDVSFAEQEAEA